LVLKSKAGFMAKKFPHDEFDDVASHGGRHRVRRTARIRALEFLRILVAAIVVAALAYVGLKFVDAGNLFTSSTTPVAKVSETDIAKGLEITVLDATGVTGTADIAAKKLVDAGFNVVAASELAGDNSTKAKVPNTVVYYFDKADKLAAAIIAKRLGAFPVKQSTAYAGAVTAVLGSDFK